MKDWSRGEEVFSRLLGQRNVTHGKGLPESWSILGDGGRGGGVSEWTRSPG